MSSVLACRQLGKTFGQGDVALNMNAVADVGLIELYRTVLNRARRLSLDLEINSPAVNTYHSVTPPPRNVP